MTFDIETYRKGYSVGVGGVVLHGDTVLLTQIGFGNNKGEWAIPGGFVERDETINAAIVREILEETNAQVEIKGLVAVRNRVMPAENSTYFVFLLHAANADVHPDGVEIQDAKYFTWDEVRNLPRLRPLSKLMIDRVFENNAHVLTQTPLGNYPLDEFVLYI